jgi:hypothetical protein
MLAVISRHGDDEYAALVFLNGAAVTFAPTTTWARLLGMLRQIGLCVGEVRS